MREDAAAARVQQGGADQTESTEPGHEQRDSVAGWTADRRQCWRRRRRRPRERVRVCCSSIRCSPQGAAVAKGVPRIFHWGEDRERG